MAHRIVIQYCFEESLTPVQTKKEMETIERHKLRHRYIPGTIGLRIVRMVSQWKSHVVDRQKETTKSQVMDVIREDRYLIVGEVLVTCLGLGNHLFRIFCQIFQ